jgi:hypothetical protein
MDFSDELYGACVQLDREPRIDPVDPSSQIKRERTMCIGDDVFAPMTRECSRMARREAVCDTGRPREKLRTRSNGYE